MKRVCLFMILVCMMMVSCKPEPEKPEGPVVITSGVTYITTTSAVCGGGVSDGGGAVVVERGVCWNTSGNPTVLDFSTKDGSGLGSYISNITGLEYNTTYYVRAYAANANGVAGYGEEVSFTTFDKYNGHEYVDLGLPGGLLWATCNVVATSPEEYGDYFAWGETSPKDEYTEDNSSTYGKQMSDISGNAQYDAATANWGGDWRMPTEEEMSELLSNCTWIWTAQNGVNGYNVKGPNGNSIFLPAAGYRYRSSLGSEGRYGCYWSSTPSDCLCFDGISGYVIPALPYSRYKGLSVRPVVE